MESLLLLITFVIELCKMKTICFILYESISLMTCREEIRRGFAVYTNFLIQQQDLMIVLS